MAITTAGIVTLYDTDKTSEKTGPQIFSTPITDSRVYPNNKPITYRCIRTLVEDPTCQLAELAVIAQMVHTPWVVTSYKSQATPEMVDFVDKNLLVHRDFFLQQAVSGTLRFGWQAFETIYKPEGGQIWIDCFKALLQDYTDILVYINNGKFAGVINETGTADPKILNNEYSFVINFDVEGTDWYGNSVYRYLRKTLSSWDAVEGSASRYDKKIAGAAWVVYYPVGKSPYGSPAVETDNGEIANALLTKLEASGSIAIPDEVQEWVDDSIDTDAKGKWRVELITADSNSQSGFIDRGKYLDALKVRAFGFTERSLLEGSKGTKEEASVHTDISLATIDTKHRLICHWLNWYVVPNLMRLNFGKQYMWSVRVIPAPLADNKFNTIKSIYHALIQNADPEQWEKIVGTLDIPSILTELGLPHG